MAKVQNPGKMAGKAPVKKNKKNSSDAGPKKKVIVIYCELCRKSYRKHEAQEHVHSMLHHRELETVLGKNSFHQCQACKSPSMGLNDYAAHISTVQHQAMLQNLKSKQIKPLSLCKTLSKETMDWILERNKMLKKEERKASKKTKKKLKQAAGQKRLEMLQESGGKTTVVVKLDKSKQGRSNAVVQNKENSLRASTLHTTSERLVCLSGEPAGQNFNSPSVSHQFTQPQLSIRIQPDRLITPHSTQGGAVNKPTQTTWSTTNLNDYYSKQYDEEFTSDNLPNDGAIIFGAGSSQLGQENSAKPASADKSTNVAPVREVDVSAMLRQIRRALGVREPCKADREARRQSSEPSKPVANHNTTQQVRAKKPTIHITSTVTTSVRPSQVKSSAPASHSKVSPAETALPTPKQRTSKTTQEMTKSSAFESGPSNSSERESQWLSDSSTSLSQCSTAPLEPNLNSARKVRIAHKSARVQVGKDIRLKTTLNRLITLSGAKGKSSWRSMYEESKKKRKQLGGGKSVPRFGIEFVNPLLNQGSSTQSVDSNMTLSEGFHWESFPDNPSNWPILPPPPQNTTLNDSRTETQSDSQIQEPLESPGAAQEGCSSWTVDAISVKKEPRLVDQNGGDLSANSSAGKRKLNVVCDGISDKEPSGKKKKTKSNKEENQMDRLLAVSLREDELSHLLQNLDRTLIQARNAMQAAYTEVQRLLLLRQQFTSEVNTLRAQRIEILQGMQEGYEGAEKATTSSSAAVVQPSLSPSPNAFPSSSQQPPPTDPASSISPLALPTMPVKQQVSCTSDTPQEPANQPVPSFPSLLPPSPALAAPTAAVISLTQLRTDCSKSPSTNHVPESSAGQQTARSTVEELKPADSDSVEEGGKTGTEQAKVKEPAAKKPVSTSVPKRDKKGSAAASDDDGGNESDDSVKIMEPSDVVIIDIDESDNEVTAKSPVHQEPPQKSVSVEFRSSSTETPQRNYVESKVEPKPEPVNASSVAPESINVVADEEPSVGVFVNHTGPVHGLQVHDGRLYTCSGDNTARAYSLATRECLAVFEGHTNKVNCLLVSAHRLITGSSDQTIRCYSIKSTKCLDQISLLDRVLCLHVAWNILYAGLANGSVVSHDLTTLKHLDVFECHGPRGVSCLGTSQEGARRVLLVGSYDSTISVRDARSGLLLRSLQGHTKTVLCMKVVNDLVFSGSSDTSVQAHNIHTGELLRIYKGHDHAVTSIAILGKVMVTACLDKIVRVYELQSHDRLQVYGGHSDMVMCMAIHKSVVYTGCYDGSVQAVKLNLMQNYRCWWQNCTLIFGMAEHLCQHLVRDHSNPNMQAVKCRWRQCSAFFGTQQSVQEKLPEHMQSHVESDSEVQP